MDIQSAAHYLKVGYRIRRGCWEQDEYLEDNCGVGMRRMTAEYPLRFDIHTGKMEKKRMLRDNNTYDIDIQELLTNDWEVVWDGIKTHCNAAGRVEYLEHT
jgi:hypothetical protein